MTIFDRGFDPTDFEQTVDKPENAWFRELLKYWRPAGDVDAEPQADHLRLAIRDRYLNFYRNGQSVAKVTVISGRLEAEIHNKYVYRNKKGGQECVKISAGMFAASDGSRVCYSDGLVHDWISEANTYAKGEKLFVDEIVARNANVIDLEAALPADSELWEARSAPRMDLVAMELCGNRWKLVFWEAKLVGNPEARCRNGLPPVVGQLEPYKMWLEKNQKVVCDAYRQACSDLVKLHGIAKSLYPDKAELGQAITTVGGRDASELGVDSQPRLIIDDRRSKTAAFERNGHLNKLRGCGLHVRMVRSEADMML